jgi:hypothetical protein
MQNAYTQPIFSYKLRQTCIEIQKRKTAVLLRIQNHSETQRKIINVRILMLFARFNVLTPVLLLALSLSLINTLHLFLTISLF